MSTYITGNQTDFHFTCEGNTLKVVENNNTSAVIELDPDDYTVVFSGGGTVNLSQAVNNIAASSSSLYFGSASSTALVGGGYVLTWEYYGEEEGVLLQQYNADGTLFKENKLLSTEAEDPTVTAKADGGYIVAWSADVSDASTVQVQQYSAQGVATGKPQVIASSKTLELDDAVVTVLENGKFVVTWSSIKEEGDEDSDQYSETGDIFSQLFDANGNKQGAVQKVSGATVDNEVADDQVILPTADGGFLVTYVRETSSVENGSTVYHSALYVREFTAAGTPKTSEPVQIFELDGAYQKASYPALLATDNGYLLTWVALVNDGLGNVGRALYAQKLDDTFAHVGGAVTLTPGSGSNANDASLTQLDNGQYVAVWTTYEGGMGNSVYALIYSAGLEKEGDRITVKANANTYEPEVTAVEGGGFVITWIDGANQFGASNMLSQKYDAAGNQSGDIVTTISGDETDNTLAWSGDDGVTLQGYNGDDTLSGGTGGDILDGGNGNDTVIVHGDLAENTFSFEDGTLVVSGPMGHDRLISIENVQFNDALIGISDGTTDLEVSAQVAGETPATAAFGENNQVVVWKQGSEVMLQILRDGNWQQVAATGIEYERGSLNVSALDDGFIVTWGNYEGGTLNAQRFDANGDEVGAPIQHAPVDANHVIDDISATALKDGGFVLSWTEEEPDVFVNGQYHEGSGNAYIQLYAADGSAVGTPQALATGALQAFEPSVSALHNGGFVVVWEYVNDANESEEIYIQRFNADGSPDGKASQVNTGTKGDQGDPEVVTLADGSYVVTWTRETDDDIRNGDQVIERTTAIDIFAQRYTADGKKAGGETQVNQGTGFHNDPVITALKGGGYVIAWATSDERDIYNGDSALYAQVFDKNGVKVGDQLVVASSDDEDYFPSISASGDGFLITWESSERDDVTGLARDVYAKQYDANGNSVTLTGDGGDNTLNWSGTTGVTLDGADGDDVLTGGEGNDTLVGGNGSDRLDGQGGANLLIGGDGDDTYVVHSARDVIRETAEGGDDTVESSISWTLGDNLENLTLTGTAAINGTGNALSNVLTGNDAKNTLNGGDGDDFLDGAGGVDTLIGGKGNDIFYVDLVAKGTGAKAVVALEDVVVEAVTGGDNDTLLLRGVFDTTATTTLTLGANLETLDASLTGATKLNLTGNALDNILIGNDSDNVLTGGAGIDTLVGNGGDDTYVIDNLAELLRVNTLDGEIVDDDGIDTLRITLKGGAVGAGLVVDLREANLGAVENVQFSSTGEFNVVGNDLNNRIDAGKTTGALTGGLGDDTYVLSSKLSQVFEESSGGTDTIEASFSADLSNYANVENLTLTGKAALNATGNDLANVLTGNDGANILDGGEGADTLIGGKGNDTYIVDDAGDTVIEEAAGGTDTIKASISFDLNDALNVENLTLTGSANLNATGNAAANTLTGNSGNNTLYGGAGVDKLLGGAGDDTYVVDLLVKGTDTKATLVLEDTITEKKGEGDHDSLVLQIGNEQLDKLQTAKATTLTLAANLENVDASQTGVVKLNLTGNAADNVIKGNDAGNVLNGGAGNDEIHGGDGDDVIIGGVGADTLTGGLGHDTFSFASLKDLGLKATQDVITDFTSGVDTLDFKALKGWSFNGVGEEHQATGTKQLWAVVDGDDLIVYGNSGGNSDADFSIKLAGISTISAADFVLA